MWTIPSGRFVEPDFVRAGTNLPVAGPPGRKSALVRQMHAAVFYGISRTGYHPPRRCSYRLRMIVRILQQPE